MFVLIDCKDSFTYNLRDYLQRAGAEVVVRTHEQAPREVLKEENWEGVILSPGPGRPKSSGHLMEFTALATKRFPTLGICLGAQAIGELFNAPLVHACAPLHGKIREVFRVGEDEILLAFPESFKVVRYNSLVLGQVPKECKELIRSKEGELMGFRHESLPVWGFQYHPEAWETEWGMPLFKNWVDSCRKNR